MRALHFVLKVANLKKNLEFFRDQLGMKVLRHEVFDEGCEAACNGPYDNKWSKTMIGYGPEDDYFVLELTYNYSIGRYNLGNDLQYIKIGLKQKIFDELKSKLDDSTQEEGEISVNSPDGYQFKLSPLNEGESKQDVQEVCLSCKDIDASLSYWVDLLGMNRLNEDKNIKEALLSPKGEQTNPSLLRLKQIDEDIDHKTAYGRIAFSCPSEELKPLQKKMEDAKHKILTPYVSLETPGKATVEVVILADPDGHEICFVCDEGFRDLSQPDTNADELIEKSISEDKSEEWYMKKKKSKEG